ncbi:general secretion pathway protein GspE, partial [Mycobacterium tuberculosis]
ASGARPARAPAVRCRWLFSSGPSFPPAALPRSGLPALRLVPLARPAGGSPVPRVPLLVPSPVPGRRLPLRAPA